MIKSAQESTYCPRCGRAFECKAHAIDTCACSQLSLSPQELQYIQTQGVQEVCYCLVCLQELKAEYQKKQMDGLSTSLENNQ
jgi:hypothetical protein